MKTALLASRRTRNKCRCSWLVTADMPFYFLPRSRESKQRSQDCFTRQSAIWKKLETTENTLLDLWGSKYRLICLKDEDGGECVNCVLFFLSLFLSGVLHKVNMVLSISLSVYMASIFLPIGWARGNVYHWMWFVWVSVQEVGFNY